MPEAAAKPPLRRGGERGEGGFEKSPIRLQPKSDSRSFVRNVQIIATLEEVRESIKGKGSREEHLLTWAIGALKKQEPQAPIQPTAEEAEQLELITSQRRAPSTTGQYKREWEKFEIWVHDRTLTLPAMPAHPKTVTLYLLSLAERGLSHSAVVKAKNAISSRHKERRAPDPTTSKEVINFIQGHARSKKKMPHQAEGLTEEKLGKIRKRTNDGMVTALVSVMRDAMLRSSEASRMRWEDVTWHEDGSATLLIPHSKTDQAGEGHTAYLTRETAKLLRSYGQREGSRPFPWHRDTIGRKIARLCEQAGLGKGFSGHSPRVGMAQDLIRANASLIEVQREGRWKSPSMPAYYGRNEEAMKGAVATRMERRR